MELAGLIQAPAAGPGLWTLQGACRTVDPDLHHPGSDDESSRAYQEQAEQAKAVCRACPVIAECLVWALAHDEFGVWGATTPDERHALRHGSPKSRRRHGTAAPKIRSLARFDGLARRPSPGGRLTARQIQILQVAARGGTYRDIGGELGITYRTVSTQLDRARRKLDVRSTADAVACAFQLGLIAAPARAQRAPRSHPGGPGRPAARAAALSLVAQGAPASVAATQVGVSERSVHRWIAGTTRPAPRAARRAS